MRLCVAVPCFNGEATIGGCLDSLLAQTRPADEIIVVDDGSRDGSRAAIQSYDVRLLRHEANRGVAAARNTALSASEADVVLYIDADAEADPDLVGTILSGFSGEGIVGVGGQGIEANIHNAADRWRALYAAQGYGPRPRDDCHFLFGLCMAYRCSALLAVGGFSPMFRTNAEDLDIGFRLTAAGGRLAYDPAARVFHQRRDDEASLLRTVRAWYYWAYVARANNHRQPWRLWAGALRRAVVEPLTALIRVRDPQLVRFGVWAAGVRLSALRAAARDWRAGVPGAAWQNPRD